MAVVVTFLLGHVPDMGWLAGLPGITPLELHGDRFTARVSDPEAALRELQGAGFPAARRADSAPHGRIH